MADLRLCSITGCGKRARTRGYCPMHYQRWRHHGDPLASKKIVAAPPSACAVDGCNKTAQSRGLCPMHYQRRRLTGSVGAAAPKIGRYGGASCSVETCERKAFCLGFCRMHYQRWKAHGDATKSLKDEPTEQALFVERAVVYQGDDCLVWPYAKAASGHARWTVNGRGVQVSRVVLERVFGPPPSPKHHAAHAPVVCHNPACVNPRHLRWATARQNSADRLQDDTAHQGERVNGARLTEDQVRAIRADPRPQTIIAKDYGVYASHISRIKSRQVWGHIP